MLQIFIADCSSQGKPNAKLYLQVTQDPELCTIYIQKMLVGIHLALKRTDTTRIREFEGKKYLFCGSPSKKGLTEIMLREVHLSLRDSSTVGVTTDYVRRIRMLLTLLQLNYIDKKTKLYSRLVGGNPDMVEEIYTIGDERIMDTALIEKEWPEFQCVMEDTTNKIRQLPIGKLRKTPKNTLARSASSLEMDDVPTPQFHDAMDEYMKSPAYEAISGPVYHLMQALLKREHPTLATLPISEAEEVLHCKDKIKMRMRPEEIIDFMYV